MLILCLFLVSNALAQDNSSCSYYVKPTGSPAQDCPPGQPCYTLDQYAGQAETFFTTGTTFLFLAGNHTTRSTIYLVNVSAIALLKNDNESSVTIMCRNTIIFCDNIRNLTIDGLEIKLHSSDLQKEYSALELHTSTGIRISKTTFQGCGRLTEAMTRAVYSRYSDIKIASCYFSGNTGYDGGAVLAVGSNVVLTGNTFTRNKAIRHGGAMFAYGSYINAVSLTENFETENHTAAHALYVSNEARSNGGAVYLCDSSASLGGMVVKFINNSAENGGAIYVEQYEISADVAIKAEHLYFIGNKAEGDLRAGAIYVSGASFSMGSEEGGVSTQYFSTNTPLTIFCMNNVVKITGNSLFIKNGRNSTAGGGIRTLYTELTLTGNATFHYNLAELGGAIFVEDSNAVIDGMNIEFKYNRAVEGGGIYSKGSNLTIRAERLYFIGNTAHKVGGAFAISTYNYFGQQQTTVSGNFSNNTADCGGAISTVGDKTTLIDVMATGNSKSALCIAYSNVTFMGTTVITGNTGRFGGGINSKDSMLLFADHFEISNNQALLGGGIYALYGEVNFQRTVASVSAYQSQVTSNTADEDGGAIYAISAYITLNRLVYFTYNCAQNGGAIYLKTAARLILERMLGALFRTAHNQASKFGGVIYSEDSAALIQCEYKPEEVGVDQLPHCPLQLNFNNFQSPATSYLNSAKEGVFMYGGLLDRCRLNQRIGTTLRSAYTALGYLDVYSHVQNLTKEMASPPYQLCFCESSRVYDCSGGRTLSVQRGQLFQIPLIAFDETMATISTVVIAVLSSTARFELDQNPQFLSRNCSNLTYNVYSTNSREELTLYPDGPCRDNGLARAVINLTILPCPNAFQLSASGEQCECEERLKAYGAQCKINHTIYISKPASSKFWMSSLSINGTYQGLVLYKTCPLEYCNNSAVNITLDNPDIQCNRNRGGVLCGRCKANYSLFLSSYHCHPCSDVYLTLLLYFAAAGIVLVVSISILRLTVATGMMNSIILYANIVQVNRDLFFATGEQTVFTVFIAWINLDFGFQTCFYNGMDAYAQTWLQFVFPLYIWAIISLIIFTSRYSVTVSKMIGHNPIAVLATLPLMSYTKILKIIIDVYSSVDLDYPDNKKVTVWLKDPNVPYLKSRHLALTVFTSLILAFLFLPYTLLLLLGHKFYRCSGRNYFSWFNNLKPLLDSYYAPYKIHTRYWTGLLLLVRCALYIIFSFNPLGATTISLLAINIAFTTMVIIAWLSVQVYRNFFCNIIEASVYLNLIILSSSTMAGVNTPALVKSLAGMVFVTTLGIVVYHFHLLYTAKSSMWLTIRAKVTHTIGTIRNLTQHSHATAPLLDAVTASSHDPHGIFSRTVIDLREPLIEN